MTGRFSRRAFAKINLGLEVLGLRPDGYHELRTVYQSLSLCDLLEIHSAKDLSLTVSGEAVPSGEDNLVMKAARALQRHAGCSKGARIALTKRIPTQAGLGGGSSDAAATLLALTRLWRLGFSAADLLPIASPLGSDVPFFLLGGTALGIGRGEEVFPLPDGPLLHLVLAQPRAGMATSEAYSRLSRRLTEGRQAPRIASLVQALVEGRLAERLLFNCFEEVNLEADEESAKVRRSLLDHGATVTLLAGSGSAWAGIFPDRESALTAQRHLVPRGIAAIHTSTLTRRDYWVQTTPSGAKE